MGNSIANSKSNEKEMDWADFTKNQNYQQNIANTYANREECDYGSSDPHYRENQMKNTINTDKAEINQVKVNFNLLETKIKCEADPEFQGAMTLQLPLYLINEVVTVTLIMCGKRVGD